MIKQNKYGVSSFKFGNRNLEFFSSYGAFFVLCFIFTSIFYFSIYYYFNPNIKYIYWGLVSLLSFSALSMIVNYFFILSKIKKDDVKFSFPEFIYEGEEKNIELNFKNKNKNKGKNIFLRFSIKNFEDMINEDIKDIKLFYNTNNKKWGNHWGYGGYLGYNAYDFLPIDFEQVCLSDKCMHIYGKKRGEVIITELRISTFDIFGFFKVIKKIKIDPISIKVLPKNNSKNKIDIIKIKKSISEFGSLNTPNIIGIKKGKRGESSKNTHWKIFAKKEEQWVYVKEKIDLRPVSLWLDSFISSKKEKSNQYENMISDIITMLNDKVFENIIINNQVYSVKKDKNEIISMLVNLKSEEINLLNNLEKIEKCNNIIFITVNDINELKYNDLLKEMKLKNINIRILKYD